VVGEEVQPPGLVRGGQSFEEQAAEEAREHPHGQKEAGPAGNPALAVGRKAAARDDDMGVRMVGQCRSPGVEDGGESDARAEVLGVGRDGDQGLGGGFEQQVINDGLVLIGDVGDRSRQGEDDVEVRHGQEFGLAVGQPLLGSDGLALWAMPIAAGVVRDPQVGAGLAALDMTAQRRRSATLDRRHDLELAEAHMAGMGRTPSRSAVAEDVRHLDRWP
jgi:hypothetical protein